MEHRTNFKSADLGFWVFWLKTYSFITVCHCAIRVPLQSAGPILFRQTQVSGSCEVRPNNESGRLLDSSATQPPPP